MTRLLEALQALGLEGEHSLSGRWVKLQGERCSVFIVEAAWGNHFYTWCSNSQERVIMFYGDPVEAIQAGLRQADSQSR